MNCQAPAGSYGPADFADLRICVEIISVPLAKFPQVRLKVIRSDNNAESIDGLASRRRIIQHAVKHEIPQRHFEMKWIVKPNRVIKRDIGVKGVVAGKIPKLDRMRRKFLIVCRDDLRQIADPAARRRPIDRVPRIAPDKSRAAAIAREIDSNPLAARITEQHRQRLQSDRAAGRSLRPFLNGRWNSKVKNPPSTQSLVIVMCRGSATSLVSNPCGKLLPRGRAAQFPHRLP